MGTPGRFRTARPARKRGFTLIELMVTIAILAILATLGVPSFVGFLRNSQLTSSTNNFIAGLNAARSEGMKRNMRGVVAPISGSDWSGGWRTFVDVNRNATYNEGTDILILQGDAMPSFLTVTPSSSAGTGSAALNYVLYDGSGFSRSSAGDPASFMLELKRNDSSGTEQLAQTRRVKIAITGRASVCTPKSSSDTLCTTTAD